MSDKNVKLFCWVDYDTFKKGQKAKIVLLESALVPPGDDQYMKKTCTGTIIKINSPDRFETKNTVYIRKKLPYFNYLVAGNIPVLRDEVIEINGLYIN